jgi:hypothetical protein
MLNSSYSSANDTRIQVNHSKKTLENSLQEGNLTVGHCWTLPGGDASRRVNRLQQALSTKRSTMLEQLQLLDGHEQIVAAFIVAVITFLSLCLYGEKRSLRRTGFSVILPGDEFIHRGPECPDEVRFCQAQEHQTRMFFLAHDLCAIVELRAPVRSAVCTRRIRSVRSADCVEHQFCHPNLLRERKICLAQ